MGLLQPYRGIYVNASSASSLMDVSTILTGCNAVEAEVSLISKCAKMITEYALPMDEKNFSVDGQTVYGLINEYCTAIVDIQNNIFSTVEQIREAVESQYNSIQQELDYEAQVNDKNEFNKRNGR